eukprot:6111760-Amphidinium_carterae.1
MLLASSRSHVHLTSMLLAALQLRSRKRPWRATIQDAPGSYPGCVCACPPELEQGGHTCCRR